MKGLELWSRRAFCVFVAIGGASALYLTLIMNKELGASFGATENGQFIQSNSAMLVDIFAAFMMLACGFAYRDKLKGLAVFTGVLALAFGFYSLIGIVGFGAKERIAKTQAIEKAQKKNDKAVADANAAAVAERATVLGWLKSSATEAGGRVERGQYIDKALDLTKTPVPVAKFDAKDEMSADPQSEVLAETAGHLFTGVTRDGVQLWLVFALGVLLKAAEMSAFFLSGAMWPKKHIDAVDAEDTAASVPPASAANDTAPKSAASRSDTVDLDYRRDMAIVARWRREATTAAPADVSFKADKVFGWFQEWVRQNNIDTAMSQTRFGTLCGEIGIMKVKRGGYVVYLGLNKRLEPSAGQKAALFA